MSRNDITGEIISTGQAKGDKELYDSGWDRIFGKKQKEPSPDALEMFRKIGQGDWSMDAAYKAFKDVPPRESVEGKSCGCLKSCGGTREEYDSDCFGWNNCSYCDNGWFPCNQNCVVFG